MGLARSVSGWQPGGALAHGHIQKVRMDRSSTSEERSRGYLLACTVGGREVARLLEGPDSLPGEPALRTF